MSADTCCFESSSRPNDDRNVRYEITSSGRIERDRAEVDDAQGDREQQRHRRRGEVARKQRQEVLPPDLRDPARAREGDRRGRQPAVDAEVGRRHRAERHDDAAAVTASPT